MHDGTLVGEDLEPHNQFSAISRIPSRKTNRN